MRQDTAPEMVRIWDPFVRAGHWVIVAGFATAYLVGDETLGVHVWAGYAVGAVVFCRVIWGLVGPRRARFDDFIYRPWAVVAYAIDLLRLRARRYVGHSPAGGTMVVVLLLMLGATVYTGLVVYALESNRGPLAAFYVEAPGPAPVATEPVAPGATVASTETFKKSDDPAARARRKFWKWLHNRLTDATLILIVLHLGGVAWASFAHRENLVGAMITGRKRREPD